MATVIQLSMLLAAGSLLFALARRWPGWVIFAVTSFAAMLDLLKIGSRGADIGVHFHIDDATSVILLAISFLLLIQHRKNFCRDVVPCLVLVALAALSFARGIGSFGLREAGNGPRLLLIFTTPALAIMLLRPAFRLDSARLARWIRWAGLCFGVVAVLRWAGLLPIPEELEEDLRGVVRTIPADHALVVGQAFIAAIYLQVVGRGSRWWWIGTGALGVLTLVLQHRSVWVATAAGVTWIALRSFRLLPARWLRLSAIACVAGCMVVLAAPKSLLDSTFGLVITNIQETQNEDSTWAWRVEGYKEATIRLLTSKPVDILIGPPAGWVVSSRGSFASMAIHSRYVDALAYYGVVGFAVLFLWLGMLARRVAWPTESLKGSLARDHVGCVFLEALLLSEILYLIAYYGTVLQGSLLGLIWVAAKQRNVCVRRVAFSVYDPGPGIKSAILQK